MSPARARLAGFFLGAGVLHLTVLRRFFESIVPPWLPFGRERINRAAGAAEIAGGALALLPGAERHARRYLTLLLMAVFPANVHMALRPADLGAERYPRWALWVRLPLQFALIRWVGRTLEPR